MNQLKRAPSPSPFVRRTPHFYIYIYICTLVHLTCDTYIDIDSVSVEYCRLWVVWWDVSVEFVSIPVPFDGVKFVSFEIVAASQLGILTPDGVRRDQHVHQLDRAAQIWNESRTEKRKVSSVFGRVPLWEDSLLSLPMNISTSDMTTIDVIFNKCDLISLTYTLDIVCIVFELIGKQPYRIT